MLTIKSVVPVSANPSDPRFVDLFQARRALPKAIAVGRMVRLPNGELIAIEA